MCRLICWGEVYSIRVGERSVETSWTLGTCDPDTRSISVDRLGDAVRKDREQTGNTLEVRRDETVSGRMDARRDPDPVLGVLSDDASGSIEISDGECMDEGRCEGGGESTKISGSSASGVKAVMASGKWVTEE